ncbi:metal-sulfur cluster assembly factor [Schlesneria paludicola]|uniref:metal-sulfur cluster assembly factor n=1 Tax=Schlesneria paludicola TaxID=360056 RepID=UPI00029AFAAB|nr:metal-sulfur cluster assembly factor [Schlesneria paludicola]
MTTETGSLPIAPASGCCSETPASEKLPVATESKSSSGCCSDTATIPAPSVPVESAVSASSVDAGTTTEGSAGETASTGDATPPDDTALIDALREVIDPELMINIVDLGLVYSINQTDKKVLVEMTLTSPACPAGPQIISQAKMSLEKLAGVETAEIKLTMSPPWTPDRMTDEARDQLGIF